MPKTSRFERLAAQAALAKARSSATSPALIDANGSAWLGGHLLAKRDVLAITNVTFPTLWAWMRAGKFPRARVVGAKSMWLSTDIEAWMAALPVRQLKGDEPKARDTWDHENLRNAAALRAKRKHQRDDKPSEVIPTSS